MLLCSESVSQSVSQLKISCLQEHYMGMNIESDGEPLGALLLRPWAYD